MINSKTLNIVKWNTCIYRQVVNWNLTIWNKLNFHPLLLFLLSSRTCLWEYHLYEKEKSWWSYKEPVLTLSSINPPYQSQIRMAKKSVHKMCIFGSKKIPSNQRTKLTTGRGLPWWVFSAQAALRWWRSICRQIRFQRWRIISPRGHWSLDKPADPVPPREDLWRSHVNQP